MRRRLSVHEWRNTNHINELSDSPQPPPQACPNMVITDLVIRRTEYQIEYSHQRYLRGNCGEFQTRTTSWTGIKSRRGEGFSSRNLIWLPLYPVLLQIGARPSGRNSIRPNHKRRHLWMAVVITSGLRSHRTSCHSTEHVLQEGLWLMEKPLGGARDLSVG